MHNKVVCFYKELEYITKLQLHYYRGARMYPKVWNLKQTVKCFLKNQDLSIPAFFFC